MISSNNAENFNMELRTPRGRIEWPNFLLITTFYVEY